MRRNENNEVQSSMYFRCSIVNLLAWEIPKTSLFWYCVPQSGRNLANIFMNHKKSKKFNWKQNWKQKSSQKNQNQQEVTSLSMYYSTNLDPKQIVWLM